MRANHGTLYEKISQAYVRCLYTARHLSNSDCDYVIFVQYM